MGSECSAPINRKIDLTPLDEQHWDRVEKATYGERVCGGLAATPVVNLPCGSLAITRDFDLTAGGHVGFYVTARDHFADVTLYVAYSVNEGKDWSGWFSTRLGIANRAYTWQQHEILPEMMTSKTRIKLVVPNCTGQNTINMYSFCLKEFRLAIDISSKPSATTTAVSTTTTSGSTTTTSPATENTASVSTTGMMHISHMNITWQSLKSFL